MKLAPTLLATLIAAAASPVYAQGKAHEHGTQPPCCDSGAPAAFNTSGVVKKLDPARGSASITHAPIPELKWPAMTMVFKVKDKALLDRLTVEKKIDFSFVREGKDYVITAVK